MGDGAGIASFDADPSTEAATIVLFVLITPDGQRFSARGPRQAHLADAGLSDGEVCGSGGAERRRHRLRARSRRVHRADPEGVLDVVAQTPGDVRDSPRSAAGDVGPLTGAEHVGRTGFALKVGVDAKVPHLMQMSCFLSLLAHWRYVDEFSGRHNVRPLDTADQMDRMAAGAVGKRLTYAELIGPKETRQPRML